MDPMSGWIAWLSPTIDDWCFSQSTDLRTYVNTADEREPTEARHTDYVRPGFRLDVRGIMTSPSFCINRSIYYSDYALRDNRL